MAHFAKIGLNSKVIDVVTVSDQELHDSNGVEREVIGVTFLTNLTGWAIWKQSSYNCLLYTSPSPRDGLLSRMPSSA